MTSSRLIKMYLYGHSQRGKTTSTALVFGMIHMAGHQIPIIPIPKLTIPER